MWTKVWVRWQQARVLSAAGASWGVLVSVAMVAALANPVAGGTVLPVDLTTFSVSDPAGHIESLAANAVKFNGSGNPVPNGLYWNLENLSLSVPAWAVELSFAVDVVGGANTFLMYAYDVDPGEEAWALRGSMSRIGEVVAGRVVFDLLNPTTLVQNSL